MQSLTVSPASSIREAIDVIDKGGIRIAAVVDDKLRLVGSVTDGDVRRGILRGVGPDAAVSEVMNTAPVTGQSGLTWTNAMKLMADCEVRQLFIIDGDRKLQGAVTDRGEALGIDLEGPAVAEGTEIDTPVFILAGGIGTRLKPLTEKVPKPLLPVGDRPILEIIMETLARQGFRNIYLSVNYRADMVIDHFGDGSDYGVRITYLQEPERLGTAGSLSLLDDTPDGPILVMNGDLMTDIDYRHLLDFHRDHDGIITVSVREHSLPVPYGVAEIDGHSIVRLEEKPTHVFFINAGIYVLEPEILARIPSGAFYDMTDLIADLLDENRRINAFPVREYWLDIGRMEDYERAQVDAGNRSTDNP